MIKDRAVRRDGRQPAGRAEAHPMRTLQDRVNDLFEDMWQRIGKHHVAVSGRAYTGPPPHSDMSEGADDWRLEIETPGLAETDLEILVEDGAITIRGEKKLERQDSGRTYTLGERTFGRFSRRFGVPADVDARRATASYRNGVLTITAPKKPAAAAGLRRIPIKAK